MSARNEILQRLRKHPSTGALPSPWTSTPGANDLGARFEEALQASKGEVRRADSFDAALEQLGGVLREVDARAVVVNDLPRQPLLDRWPQFEWRFVDQNPEDLREYCARADVGVSGAVAALAETGTIVLHSGADRSRLATVLPLVHVALVPISCLVNDLFSWTAGRGSSALPANVTLVSGPSKTGDIEFEMTLGAHGPRRLRVILYQSGPSDTH